MVTTEAGIFSVPSGLSRRWSPCSPRLCRRSIPATSAGEMRSRHPIGTARSNSRGIQAQRSQLALMRHPDYCEGRACPISDGIPNIRIIPNRSTAIPGLLSREVRRSPGPMTSRSLLKTGRRLKCLGGVSRFGGR